MRNLTKKRIFIMKKLKKWTAVFCAAVITASFLTGCGGGGGEENASGPQPEKEKKNTVQTQEEDAEKSMGRYLEQEMTLPEEISEMVPHPIPYIRKLENGSLMLAEKTAGSYISSDDGEIWESAGNLWKDTGKGLYVTDMAISPAGAVAMIGILTGGDEAESGTETGSEAAESETGETGGASQKGGRKELDWQYYYYDAEGKEIKLDLPDISFRSFAFDNQNRLYGFAGGGKVCRIDPETGVRKELFTADGSVDFACFTDKYMVGVTTRSGVVVYDIEQDIMLDADEVMQDFIERNLGLSIGSSDEGHSVVMTAGEQEDVIYLAFDGGLYRHVIGGTAIEQIIDGATSGFGDPSLMLMDMVMLPDNEFAVLYTGMKLYRYTYDPNVPTVPDQQIKIYSLLENTTLRQAASMFQKAHQDVYIRYEIGMSGDDGVTREDAVRNLNTKLMSGEGPDILLLDGLPQASYEEKGILADLSGIAADMTGDAELFPNIVEACRKDGKLYVLPVRIQLPMMAGKSEDVQQVKDLDSLASALEKIRERKPEGALLGVRTPEQLLYILGMSSSGAWTDEKGNIDEKALEEFLTAAARIWQAEISGVPEKDLGVRDDGYGTLNGEHKEYYGNVSGSATSIMMDMQQFAVGRIRGVDLEYDMLTTLDEQEGNFDFDAWNGQVKNGFLSDTFVGISANSMENELAVEFYRYLFGKELQDVDVYDGITVNMASFEELRDNPRAGLVEGADGRAAGSIATGTPDGDYFGIEILWPTEEEFERLKSIMSSVNCISTGDERIEETVYEIGARALEGGTTPGEAVQEIVKKSAIYLAE